jgi:predicted NAD-dependent protein-ADP-ribosyltransferase YbiA (DUF1768 family)
MNERRQEVESMDTINVSSGSKNPNERILSNLFKASFALDGFLFESTEGMIQGIKFSPENPLRWRTFLLSGLEAKEMSKQAEGKYVWLLDGNRVAFGSPEHAKLIERSIRAKFQQNKVMIYALLATEDKIITHETGEEENPNTSLEKEDFCKILTNIRNEEKQKLEKEGLENEIASVIMEKINAVRGLPFVSDFFIEIKRSRLTVTITKIRYEKSYFGLNMTKRQIMIMEDVQKISQEEFANRYPYREVKIKYCI